MSRWRWIDENGRAITEWSDKPAPPESLRSVSDGSGKGTMTVQFEDTPMPTLEEAIKYFSTIGLPGSPMRRMAEVLLAAIPMEDIRD